jgi:hypothetical protein
LPFDTGLATQELETYSTKMDCPFVHSEPIIGKWTYLPIELNC